MSYFGPITRNINAPINYISNGNAADYTTGWSTYLDAALPQPVDGSGAGASITWNWWDSSLYNVLRGLTEFSLVKDAANRQGQGVSYSFDIDNADLAKVLTVSFDYEIISGSTYATGDLAVYLIQNPTGTPVVIQPAGHQIQSASVGTKMKHIATFQTASNVTSYRLCIHVASTSASAYTLAFDNVVVGPQTVQYGAPVTDWQSYTPTYIGFGTVTSNEVFWRRVGDSVEIQGKFTPGTPTATEARISLPSSLTAAGTEKIPSIKLAGVLESNNATAGGISIFTVLQEPSVSYVTVGYRDPGNAPLTKQVGSNIATSGVAISFTAKVPILGWSSTVQMSNDTDTRVVAARYYATGSQSIGGTTVINFDTKDFDTHGAVSNPSSSWTYTAPVPGIYQISAFLFTGAFPSTASWNVQIFKSGAHVATLNEWTVSSGIRGEINGSTLLSLVAGDTIQIKTSVGAGTPTLDNTSGGGKQNYVNIQRLSGPSAIAASETVAASYWLSANQAVTAAVTPINFDSKEFDSHGAVTTGAGWRFTAPIAGTYQVSAVLNQSAGGNSNVHIYKNGSSIYKGISTYIAGTTGASLAGGSTTIKLLAGEYIELRCSGSITVQGGALAASSLSSNISIHRIGN